MSVVLSILMLSCKEKKLTTVDKGNDKITVDNHRLTDSKVNSEGVFLFNSDSEILINWTEWYKERERNILKFAFFDNETQQFSEPITVSPSKGLQMHAESMAKVGITAKGIIYAVFRVKAKSNRSMFGGTMYYTISSDKGKTWSDKVKLTADPNSTSQSFFDIAMLPDGEIGITWLDSRMPIHKGRNGKTLYFAKTNMNKGFQNEIPIAGSTCECCRTEIYIDQHKRIHVAYRNIIEKDEEVLNTNFVVSDVEIRDMYYVLSEDNGKTFSSPIPISKDNWHINGCPHTGPSLALNGADLGALWFTAADNNAGIFFTSKTKGQFNERELLSADGRHPQMISLNGKFFVVYETYYELEDKGYTKIIMEEIESLKNKSKNEISDPETNNNHAVITSIDESAILLAWINTNTRNPKVIYKIIPIG